MVVLVPVPATRIWLCSQKLRNELRHRLTATSSIVVKLPSEATSATNWSNGGAEAWLRGDATALDCCSLVGGQRGEEGVGEDQREQT